MFKFINVVIGLVLLPFSSISYADKYADIGRSATTQEIVAWDIDVRPDFKGLPQGSGSVANGQKIWEGRCASCHGTFAESNEVFTPIVGGTTKEDILSGRVAALANNKEPQRTTLMKVSTLSTLWDYIHRAMPWTAPKSLSSDEVFAVTAYILNLAEIIPEDFVLTDKNIADVQKLMPNRNGMSLNHGMWDVNGNPDIKSVACMKNCATQSKIHSALPEVARNTHGNIMQQNRTFGPVRGVDTTKPTSTAVVGYVNISSPVAQNTLPPSESIASTKIDGLGLAKKNNCLTCHAVNNKIIGPAFTAIGAKYISVAGAEARLIEKVKKGGVGNWGSLPMPAQTQVNEDELKLIVNWILKKDSVN